MTSSTLSRSQWNAGSESSCLGESSANEDRVYIRKGNLRQKAMTRDNSGVEVIVAAVPMQPRCALLKMQDYHTWYDFDKSNQRQDISEMF